MLTRDCISPSAVGVDSWRRLISVVALTSVAGCSLALSGPGANRPKNRSPECDTGKGLVALDGVVGSVLGTGALVLLTENQSGAATVTALLAAAYLGAAFKGNTTVNECRNAFAAYNQPSLDAGPEEPAVATTRPNRPSRPVAVEPAPAPLPSEYVQPRTPGVPPTAPPPVAVAPQPMPVKTPPPWKDPKPAPPRPAAADAPADWRDFWTEVP